MQFEITAEASAALLCRLIGLAAQQDLAAPNMVVRVRAERMTVRLDLVDIGEWRGTILAEKMARCIGVEEVVLDGVRLGESFVSPGC